MINSNLIYSYTVKVAFWKLAMAISENPKNMYIKSLKIISIIGRRNQNKVITNLFSLIPSPPVTPNK